MANVRGARTLPFGPTSRGYDALKTLSVRGKEKMKVAIAHAQNLDDLQVLDRALQHGELPPDMAHKLGFDASDFIVEELESLAASGVAKIKAAIDNANSLEELNILDEALRANTVPKSLRTKLGFTAADFLMETEEDYDPFAEVPEEEEDDDELEELEELEEIQGVEDAEEAYDPFDEFHASDIEFDDLDDLEGAEEFIPHVDGHIEIDMADQSEEEPPAALENLVGYDSGEDEPKVKRRKLLNGMQLDVSEQSDWFKRWLSMSNHTKAHPSFMRWVTPPARTPLPKGWMRAEEPVTSINEKAPDCRLLSLMTVTVFAGDPRRKFEPYHVARVVLVDQDEKVVYDEIVRPSLPVLDLRSSTNGLHMQQLLDATASHEEVRQAVSDIVGAQETIVIGHCLHMDSVALRLCFGPKIIDTALIFEVEGKPQHFHPLRTLAHHLLRETVDMDAPHCPIQDAVWNLRIAKMESLKPQPTKSFPSMAFPLELKLNHIPRTFTMEAAEGEDGTHEAIKRLFSTASDVSRVTWRLPENDPSDWLGEATVRFTSEAERDKVFTDLHGATDVFVQWREGKGKGKGAGKRMPAVNAIKLPLTKPLPDTPSVAQFISERALVQAFSSFGIVLGARIPRKPITGIAQNFGFVGFLYAEDAERAATEHSVEVRITPKWTTRVRANVAKYGNDRDKRIPIQAPAADGEMCLDWIHVVRR